MEAPFWISLGGKSSIHCAGGWELVLVNSILCLGVFVAYLIISNDWYKRQKACKSKLGSEALNEIRIIFICCAISGYGNRIAFAFYPIWTLHIACLVYLNWRAWRYIVKVQSLDIVYKNAEKAEKLQEVRRELEYSDIKDPQERIDAILGDLKDYLKELGEDDDSASSSREDSRGSG